MAVLNIWSLLLAVLSVHFNYVHFSQIIILFNVDTILSNLFNLEIIVLIFFNIDTIVLILFNVDTVWPILFNVLILFNIAQLVC